MSDVDPAAADHGSRRPRPDRPPRPAAVGHLVGRAEDSTTQVGGGRGGHGGDAVLTFRLLTRGGSGSRTVQVRGSRIEGTVSDGDWVEVEERDRSGRLEVSQLLNLTSETQVRAVGSPSFSVARLLRVVVLVLIVAVLLLVVWVVLGMLGVAGSGWPFGQGGPKLEPGST